MANRKPKKTNAQRRQVAERLHSDAIHLLRELRDQDRRLGVPPARLSALSVLVFGRPRSLNALSEAEHVQPPTMSRIVEGLVKEGLAKRETDASDRRAVLISATEKGRKLMFLGRDQRVQRFVKLLESLDVDSLETLGRAADLLDEILLKGAAK